jgi:nanoRNase/pAp phosphatase (c-di-AMP/oligoRNAs hydrolase)
MNTEWKPDIFIYHSPCDDGFGAAWAVWKLWGDTVEFHPTNYGSAPPDVTNKNILIGDFSYKRDVLDDMAQSAASIVILDHHKTAWEDLAPFAITRDAPLSFLDVPGMLRDLAELNRPPVIALFDMAKSGARLLWEFCHIGVPVPWIIKLIEDRDLWRFTYPDTKAFSLFLRSYPYDFETWDDIADQLITDDGRQSLFGQALAIERFYREQIEKMAAGAVWMFIDGHHVPTVNCPGQFASDVGHRLLELHFDAPFAATWSDRYEGRGYSLRSDDKRADVSKVAKRYGGGGHRNAAGFEVPRP